MKPAVAALIIAAGAVTACGQGGGNTMSLPEGDVAAGQQAFVDLQCTSCHTIQGLDLPEPQVEGPVRVVFGGRLTRVKSYDDLVTSIVNPSHRLVRGYAPDRVSADGESRMPVLNDVMTVTQLINVTAFLQEQLKVEPVARYRYPAYKYNREAIEEAEQAKK